MAQVEKDIEDYLKHESLGKGIVKAIIVVLSMGTAYIIVTNFPDWFLMAILLFLLSAILMVPDLPENERKRQTQTVIKCENTKCGNQKIRDYKDGDFVFKNGGICPKCNSNYNIIEIYSKKLKEDSKQETKKK